MQSMCCRKKKFLSEMHFAVVTYDVGGYHQLQFASSTLINKCPTVQMRRFSQLHSLLSLLHLLHLPLPPLLHPRRSHQGSSASAYTS